MRIPKYKHSREYRVWRKSRKVNLMQYWKNKGYLRQIQIYQAFSYLERFRFFAVNKGEN